MIAALLIACLIAIAADHLTTREAIGRGAIERNPLVRAIGLGMATAIKASCAVGVAVLAHRVPESEPYCTAALVLATAVLLVISARNARTSRAR